MRDTGKSKTCVWRWQERFMQAGYDGLLRDKTRPSRIPPLGSDIAERVVALTRTDPPVEATHWILQLTSGGHHAHGVNWMTWAGLITSSFAIVYVGSAFYRSAWKALRRGTTSPRTELLGKVSAEAVPIPAR